MTVKAVQFNVNGRDEAVMAKPIETLLSVLRDGLGLTSVKSGCAQGGCGACSVLVDGELRLACITPAEDVAGSTIMTLEGLNESNSMAAIQESFVANYAAQCGFCTPGMLVAVAALMESNPKPSRDEIMEALAGNICRCTSYLPIVDAVESAAEELSGQGDD
jgi:carbon-monoxide dehydrogenase small subunit